MLNNQQYAWNSALTAAGSRYEDTNRDVFAPIEQAQTALVRGQSAAFGSLRSVAQRTVVAVVEADQPAASRSLSDALTEVIRQMRAGNYTVQAAVVTANATVLGTAVGNGTIVLSTKRGDGLSQENLFTESLRLTCTQDSYSGGATAGSETFRLIGEDTKGASVFDYDWPQGSGGTLTITSVSAGRDAQSTGNLLTNSDFDGWVGGNLSNWRAGNGTFGVNMVANSVANHSTSGNSLQITANATVLAALFQDTGNSACGTSATLKPLTSYAFNFWARTNTGTGTGNIVLEIVDGSNANAATADQQAVANSYTLNVANLTTSWQAFNGTFRLAAVPPATPRLRLRVTTAVAGANVLIDDLAMTPLQAAYTGGPGIAVFSGSTPWVTGDQYTVATTNDRGNAEYLASFQALFDRLFGMRDLGLLLPSSGSPTYSDTLITTDPEGSVSIATVTVDVAAGGTGNTIVAAAPAAGYYLRILGYQLSSDYNGGVANATAGNGAVVTLQSGNTATKLDIIGETSVPGGGLVLPIGTRDRAMDCAAATALVLFRAITAGVRIIGHITVETRLVGT